MGLKKKQVVVTKKEMQKSATDGTFQGNVDGTRSSALESEKLVFLL